MTIYHCPFQKEAQNGQEKHLRCLFYDLPCHRDHKAYTSEKWVTEILPYWCPWVFLAAWEGLLVLSSNILSRRHICFMGFHCWKYLKTLTKNTEPKHQQPLKQPTTPNAKLTPNFASSFFHIAGNRRDTWKRGALCATQLLCLCTWYACQFWYLNSIAYNRNIQC